MINLTILGTFALSAGGQVVADLSTDKARALLVYLVLESPRPHRREALAALLWPDILHESALNNLRQTLHRLRTALDRLQAGAGPALLIINRKTVQIHPAQLSVDALTFTHAISACQSHAHADLASCDGCLARLTQAVALYQGELLAGFGLVDAAAFEEWLLLWRENLQHQALLALTHLADACETRGDYDLAHRYAERRLALDAYQEASHRQVMRLLARRGLINQAVTHYESCRRLLHKELGSAPAAETVMLLEQIRKGAFTKQNEPESSAITAPDKTTPLSTTTSTTTVQPDSAPQQPAPPSAASAAGAPTARPPVLPHNLPTLLTSFVGRAEEIARLLAYLATPTTRLITIVGEGGVGKTRLALQVAHMVVQRQRERFPDGVYFFSLIGVNRVSFVVSALANVLGITLTGATDPEDQLLAYMRHRQMLVVLDNLEHLVATIGTLVTALLQAAPGLHLLTTSRERLDLSAEWAVTLAGLPFPTVRATTAQHDLRQPSDPAALDVAEADSAIQLFTARARQMDDRFDAAHDPAEAAALARICALVHGIPLGIEMAAAWVHMLSCREIAAEIAQNLDFLTSPHSNTPARHRNLRAVFDHSWQLLTPGEQAAFPALALFADSFTIDAAMVVAGVQRADLFALANKSLLQIVDLTEKVDGGTNQRRRYKLHEVIRQYAKEKLTTAGVASPTALAQRHCEYYSALVAGQEPRLASAQVAQALTAIGADLSNIVASWRYAVLHWQIGCLEQSVRGLFRFYLLREPLAEAQGALEWTVETLRSLLANTAPPQPAAEIFLSKLLALNAEVLNERGFYAQAITTAQSAIALAQARQGSEPAAMGYLQWGIALQRQGHWAEASARVQASLTLATDAALPSLQADAWRALGRIAAYQGDYQTASAWYQQALQRYQQLGDLLNEGKTYQNLVTVAIFSGDYEQGLHYCEVWAQQHRQLGNRTGLAMVLFSLGAIYTHLGAYTQAQRHYEESLMIKREMGDRQLEGQLLANLGLLWHHLGDNERASDYCRQAVQISSELGERDPQAYALTCLGHAQAARQESAAAAQSYEQGLALRRTLQQASQALEPLAGLAHLAWLTGDLATAQRYVAEILHGLQHYPLAGIVELLRIYLVCYRVLAAVGDPRAEAILAQAYAILNERRQKIRDETLLAAFVGNVAANREILAAYQRCSLLMNC